MGSGKSTAIPPLIDDLICSFIWPSIGIFGGGFPGLSTGLPDFFGRLALAASKKRGYKGREAPDPAAAPGCVWDGPGGVSSNMATWEIAAWNGLFKRTIIETLKFGAFSSQPCLFTGGYMLCKHVYPDSGQCQIVFIDHVGVPLRSRYCNRTSFLRYSMRFLCLHVQWFWNPCPWTIVRIGESSQNYVQE